MPGVHQVAAPSTDFSRESFTLLVQLPPSISSVWWGIKICGLAEIYTIPLPCPYGREGSYFPGFVLLDDTVNSESVMCIKTG